MDEHLYIVVYRADAESRWKAINEGEFESRRLAENFIECKKVTGWHRFQFGVVEGPIVSPETMAEAEERLGKF